MGKERERERGKTRRARRVDGRSSPFVAVALSRHGEALEGVVMGVIVDLIGGDGNGLDDVHAPLQFYGELQLLLGSVLSERVVV